MGKKVSILTAVAIACMLLLPALASAQLVNEYGMHYAGQTKCLTCHGGIMGPSELALHGRFAQSGILPDVPEGWTAFQGPGAVEPVAGEGQSMYHAGGSYSLTDLHWITLGDSARQLRHRVPLLEGHQRPDRDALEPGRGPRGRARDGGEWMVAAEDPGKGLYDVVYSCQRCHSWAPPCPGTGTVPNPAATIQPTPTTAAQWARDESKSVAATS